MVWTYIIIMYSPGPAPQVTSASNRPAICIQRFNKNSKTGYAVIDHEFAGVDVNAGVGRGITGETDRWVMKAIIGTHF